MSLISDETREIRMDLGLVLKIDAKDDIKEKFVDISKELFNDLKILLSKYFPSEEFGGQIINKDNILIFGFTYPIITGD